MSILKQIGYALLVIAIAMGICVGGLAAIFFIVYGIMSAMGLVGAWPW